MHGALAPAQTLYCKRAYLLNNPLSSMGPNYQCCQGFCLAFSFPKPACFTSHWPRNHAGGRQLRWRLGGSVMDVTQWRDQALLRWFGPWKRQLPPQAASTPRTGDCASAARAGEGTRGQEMSRKAQIWTRCGVELIRLWFAVKCNEIVQTSSCSFSS